MHRRIHVVALLAASALAACSTDSVAPESALGVRTHLSHIQGSGLAPHTVAPAHFQEPIDLTANGGAPAMSQDAAVAAAAPLNIEYWGGGTISKQRVAMIYYSPTTIYANGPTPGSWGNGETDKSLVGFYLNNLAKGAYWNINNGYFNQLGNKDQNYIQDFMQYKSFWAPNQSPTNEAAPTAGTYVSDDEMIYLIESGFASGKLQYDPNTVYMVATGPGVNLGGGFSSTHHSYCAWHSGYWFDDGGPIVQFGAMPYDADFNPLHPSNNINPDKTISHFICTYLTTGVNNDLGAEATVSALTHEIEETATDPVSLKVPPYFAGWYDRKGQENGDKCAYLYGSTLVRPPASTDYWNLAVGGKSFMVQMNWSNVTPQGCLIGRAGPGTIGATNGGLAKM